MQIVIPGEPVAQPRHQVANGRAYIPAKHPIHAFKDSVRLIGRQSISKPLEGPIGVSLTFVFARPKRLKKTRPDQTWKDTKPDIDNLEKAVLDALNGIAWNDDGQVAAVMKNKVWAAIDEAPRTIVKIVKLVN